MGVFQSTKKERPTDRRCPNSSEKKFLKSSRLNSMFSKIGVIRTYKISQTQKALGRSLPQPRVPKSQSPRVSRSGSGLAVPVPGWLSADPCFSPESQSPKIPEENAKLFLLKSHCSKVQKTQSTKFQSL